DTQLRGPRPVRGRRGVALRRRRPGGARRRGGGQPERRPQVVRPSDRGHRRAHDLRGLPAALAPGRRPAGEGRPDRAGAQPGGPGRRRLRDGAGQQLRGHFMDFGFSEEQEMLRKSARDFLVKESPMTYVRRMMEDDRGFTDEQWKKMAELGWMGLILPEEHGGAGLTFVDLVVVLEEMGRVVLPGPFFSTVILGGVALAEGGSAAQKEELLPKIASGALRVTLAQLEPNGRWDADGIQLAAKSGGGGYRLSGTKLFVPDAHTADLLVVAGRAPGSKGAE